MSPPPFRSRKNAWKRRGAVPRQSAGGAAPADATAGEGASRTAPPTAGESRITPTAPPARLRFEILRSGRIGISFAYDPARVGAMRQLCSSKWNRGRKLWEVHPVELPAALAALGLRLEVPPDDAPRKRTAADRSPAKQTDNGGGEGAADHKQAKQPTDGIGGSRPAVMHPAVPEAIRSLYAQRWSGSVVGIEMGHLDTRITSGAPPLNAIDEVVSFEVPGHRYSTRYQAGQWDGRIRLFNAQKLTFPTGLWPKVRDVIRAHGLTCEVKKSAAPRDKRLEFGPPRRQLRDYQAEALAQALRMKRGIVQLATGGGKTLLAAHLIRELGLPTFFFVHTRELLHQSAAVLSEELGVPVGIVGDGIVEIREVNIATVQTAARVLGFEAEAEEDCEPGEDRSGGGDIDTGDPPAGREDAARALRETRVAIFDECHHLPAETTYKVARQLEKAAFRYGLSATPWRDDQRDLLLEAPLGPRICAYGCSYLIDRDYLVRPAIRMIAMRPGRLSGGRKEYAEVYRQAIVENAARNERIATEARALAAQGRSVLILVAQVRHGELLQQLLPEARFSHGQLPMDLRRSYLAELEQKMHAMLIGTTLADEGLDIPSLGAVILGGGGKSSTRAYQRIGRALRPAAGKSGAAVIDFYDQAPWLKEHSEARLRIYRHEPAFEITTEGFDA